MRLRTPLRADALLLLHATLGIWVGIYAFRTYVPTAVWNLSDALPLYMKGVLAAGVHLIGVAGCLMPFTKRPRAAAALALAVAGAGLLRQIFLGNDIIGSALSLLTWILWLWWLAACARVLARGRWQMVAAALAAAVSLQVGMQAAWHGLDLPVARGPVAIVLALIINGLFAYTGWMSADADEAVPEHGSLALAAFGVAMFLELTLFANLGRIGFITGLDSATSALLVQTGIIAGVLITHVADRRSVIFICGVLAVAATFSAPFVHGAGGLALLAGQAALIPLVASAAARPIKATVVAYTIGAMALFALLFLFYTHYEWPTLWVVAAIALVLAAVQPTNPVMPARVQPILAGLAMFLAVLGVRGTTPSSHDAAMPPHGDLRILTYNIHQGFDAVGVPAMQRIADVIEKADADVVALQEVSRGWTFLGGADLIAYLHYRLPRYDIDYVPVNGQMWGIALLSRVPRSDVRGRAFDSPPGDFRYGYTSAAYVLGGRNVRIVAMHLTAGLDGNGGGGRVDQTNQLLNAFAADTNIVVVGDFNALPGEPPIETILHGGFMDAGAAVGLGSEKSWPANAPEMRIDYAFLKGNVEAVKGTVPHTTASDHLPLIMNIRPARSSWEQ